MDSILGFEHSAHHGRWHALRLTDIQQWLSRLGNIWTCERYQHGQTRVWQDYQRWQDMDISYEGEAVGLNMMIDIWMNNSRSWVFKASGLVWEESEEGKNAQKGRGKGSLSATTWKKGISYFPKLQAAPRCNCNEKYLDIRINSLALALSAWAFASEKLTSKCCQSFINIANRRKP